MSTVSRGVRGVFRNGIRTTGVAIILALSVGLALVMLLALKTVDKRISAVKAQVGNTITISPAGFSDFSGANNALTTTQLAKIASISHVTGVTENLTGRLTTIGSAQFGFGNQNSNATTSLTSPVKLGQGGSNGQGGGPRIFINGGGQLPANFSLPISILGTSDPTQLNGTPLTIKSGKAISGMSNTNDAMVSTAMAQKNNLNVGSTFTAYGTTMKVDAIYDSGTQAGNNNVIVALPTEQRLSGQSGDVSGATATVDSVDNLSSTTTAIKGSLGSQADVENSQQQADALVSSLQNIATISLYSLIGALVAGSVIIFLTMMMVVRERRREIGVLKAIGSSNIKIVIQFVSEALTLTAFGAVIGIAVGLLMANPILQLLVTSSSSTSNGGGFPGQGGGGFISRSGGFAGGAGRGFERAIGGGGRALQALHSTVGYEVLLYGLAVAFVIAIIGSAVPAWLIAKVRPAEVMRGE